MQECELLSQRPLRSEDGRVKRRQVIERVERRRVDLLGCLIGDCAQCPLECLSGGTRDDE